MARRSYKDMERKLRAEPVADHQYKTLLDVANALGVDASTISLVLSGSPKPGDRTRKRVLEFCRKVRFRPNLMAQALSCGRSRLWGVLFPDIATSFFPGILEGIEQVANENKFTAFLSLSRYDPALMSQQIEVMQARLVEGLLIVPTGVPGEKDMMTPHLGDTPYVTMIQPFAGDSKEKCVHVDNHGGATLAMEHLYDLGHRRIGHVCGPREVMSSQERLSAWGDFLQANGLDASDALAVSDGYSREDGKTAAYELMRLPKPPTALFCASDQAALGAMDALFELGKRPGVDVSVVGFDDLCCAQNSPVPLTSVSQPKEELGRAAAIALNAAIHDEEAIYPCLMPSLVVRRSTGPIAQK